MISPSLAETKKISADYSDYADFFQKFLREAKECSNGRSESVLVFPDSKTSRSEDYSEFPRPRRDKENIRRLHGLRRFFRDLFEGSEVAMVNSQR
jgi:hypothetical protein